MPRSAKSRSAVSRMRSCVSRPGGASRGVALSMRLTYLSDSSRRCQVCRAVSHPQQLGERSTSSARTGPPRQHLSLGSRHPTCTSDRERAELWVRLLRPALDTDVCAHVAFPELLWSCDRPDRLKRPRTRAG